MIHETPLLGRIDLQTPDFGVMGFVLDYSTLGSSLGDGDATVEWRTWVEDAGSIVAQRGAERDGVEERVDVGVMTALLVNAADPLAASETLTPGRLIRAVAVDEGGIEPLFTGRVKDVAARYVWDNIERRYESRVTVTAADAVSLHTKTPRYGAMPPTGFETLEERIIRLAGSSRTPIEPPTVGAPKVVYSLG